MQDERKWPKQTEIVQTNEGAKVKVKEKSIIMVATENNTFMNDQFERFRSWIHKAASYYRPGEKIVVGNGATWHTS